MCHLRWLLNFFRFLTFTLKAGPPAFRCFDAASSSFQAGLRARRDLVMYNWCGLAEEGEEDEEEGGRFWTTPTQREQTRVGLFFRRKEGNKCRTYKFVSVGGLFVSEPSACLCCRACSNKSAAPRCSRTLCGCPMNGVAFCLVGIPPYSETHVSAEHHVDNLGVVVFGAPWLVRERDSLRGLTLVYPRTHRHSVRRVFLLLLFTIVGDKWCAAEWI